MQSLSGGGEGRYYRPAMFGGFSFFPPVIKTLLISNGVVWIFFGVLLPFIREYVNLWPLVSVGNSLALHPLGSGFWPWQPVTYLFVHGGFWHIFFNMLMLWMFGMELEYTWGSAKFLLYYLLCGIGAAAVILLVASLRQDPSPTVGASGAIFGVLVAFAMLWPDRPIYVYFLLPVRAKFFIAGAILFELVTGIGGSTDGISHVAHLGGAAVGFLFMYTERHSDAFKAAVARLVGGGVFRRASRPGPRPWPGNDVRDARFYEIGGPPDVEDETEVTQEVIDAILDKISRGGYQSLSDHEKRILNEASRKIH